MIPHLQAEGRHHGLVVADSIAHDAGVFVLRDQERILVRPIIGRGRCRLAVLLVLWRRSFGFDAPQDSVRPGWFSFLPTECSENLVCVLHQNAGTKKQNRGRRKGAVHLTACCGGCQKWRIPFKMVLQLKRPHIRQTNNTGDIVEQQRDASVMSGSGSPVMEGQEILMATYGDTNLGGSSSLCQAPNQTESSAQVSEVRRKKKVVLPRCRGRGLYMVRGNATVLFLTETHTRHQFTDRERSGSAAPCAVACLTTAKGWGVKSCWGPGWKVQRGMQGECAIKQSVLLKQKPRLRWAV